jgi:biotin carboxyl carrier protein
MRLRIEVEGALYDVNVDFLPDSALPPPPAVAIPAPVLHERAPQKLPEDRFCLCPITGRVVLVMAGRGQKVKKNEPVLVIEAMKMEINVGPSVDGVVDSIHVKPGDTVKSGEVLFELS